MRKLGRLASLVIPAVLLILSTSCWQTDGEVGPQGPIGPQEPVGPQAPVGPQSPIGPLPSGC